MFTAVMKIPILHWGRVFAAKVEEVYVVTIRKTVPEVYLLLPRTDMFCDDQF